MDVSLAGDDDVPVRGLSRRLVNQDTDVGRQDRLAAAFQFQSHVWRWLAVGAVTASTATRPVRIELEVSRWVVCVDRLIACDHPRPITRRQGPRATGSG